VLARAGTPRAATASREATESVACCG